MEGSEGQVPGDLDADEFGRDDPESLERERRRREREERRKQQEAQPPRPPRQKVELPKIAVPKIRPPKIEMPKLAIPKLGGAPRLWIAGAGIAALAAVGLVAVLVAKSDNEPPPSTATVPVFNVTIPEGLNRRQVAAVAKREGIHGNYLRKTVRSKLLNPRRLGGKKADSLEGFLFPATYELEVGAGVKDLVSRQLATFKQKIKGVNQRYARRKNLNTYDVVTIASMIEREVQVAAERPLVAAVIYNRLKAHMPLGIDATVRFATGNFKRPLTRSQLNTSSPYNTRKFAGLPPGPIGNPGLDSIKAAAKPARVRYLFYVVKPGTCGEHSFAKTEAEFNRLVARYEAARRAAGGKSPTKC
jgi:UPF0755 protein